jgi:hypothetical protein
MKSDEHNNPSLPGPRIPGGLREAELAALVGLDTDDAGRGTEPGGHPAHEVSALVANLRRDSAMLRDTRATPRITSAMSASILAGVERKLNEAAVQELIAAEQSATPMRLPISRVVTGRGSVWRDMLESSTIRRMSVAAVLLLCAGGGWLVLQGVRNAWSKHDHSLMASNSSGRNSAANTLDNGEVTRTPDGTAADAHGVAVAAADGDATRVEPDGQQPSLIASGELPSDDTSITANPPEPMTMARAMELAAEGRLVVRVRTLNAESLTKRMEIFARQRDLSGVSMRALATANMPAEYAALLTPSTFAQPAAGHTGVGPDRDPTWIAGEDGSSPQGIVGPLAQPPATDFLAGLSTHRVEVAAVYLAEISSRETDLEQIRRAITSAAKAAEAAGPRAGIEGFVQGVVLEERPAASDSQVAPVEPVAIDPSDVLWWTGPSGNWLKKVRVPVVVETMFTGSR